MTRRLAALATPLLMLLVAPHTALAITVNEDYKPQNEFKLDNWIPLPGPFDINKAVVYLFAATIITTLLFLYVANRMQARPNRIQTVVETAYVLMRDNIAGGNMDRRMAAKWFPFIAALFLFIWVSNMIGYLPLPTNTEHKVDIGFVKVPSLALYAATANLSVPLVLTVMVWVAYHVEGFRAKGFIGFYKGLVPAGVEGPAKGPIFLIELISDFVRLVSLSVRLFANVLAGHLLILFMGGGLVILLNLGLAGSFVLGAITLPLAVAFFLFEIGLVATLQAFIFSTLTAIYLGGAVAEEH